MMADGVGSMVTSLPKFRACPLPVIGSVVGVGKDEQPGTAMAGADIGSSYNTPLSVIPEGGKVSNDGGGSHGKVPADILQDDESGS